MASALLQQPQQLASTLQFQPQVVAASSGGQAAIIAATGTPTVAPTPVLPNAQQTATTAPALLTGATAAQPQPPPGSQLVSQIQQPLPFQVSHLPLMYFFTKISISLVVPEYFTMHPVGH